MRPSDLPQALHWSHGVRSRYVCGCRCEACRKANREYAHTRAKAQQRGDWNGLVDAEPARQHLLHLSARGVGARTVHSVSDVALTVLRDVKACRQKKIRARQSKRILAVDSSCKADHAVISARDTWRLVRWMVRRGYPKAELARRLGYKSPALQLRKRYVLAKTASRIQRLHRQIVHELQEERETKYICRQCGYSHAKADRQIYLRHTLPNKVEDIKDLWPCIYGGTSGERQLFRDLRDIGARQYEKFGEWHEIQPLRISTGG